MKLSATAASGGQLRIGQRRRDLRHRLARPRRRGSRRPAARRGDGCARPPGRAASPESAAAPHAELCDLRRALLGVARVLAVEIGQPRRVDTGHRGNSGFGAPPARVPYSARRRRRRRQATQAARADPRIYPRVDRICTKEDRRPQSIGTVVGRIVGAVASRQSADSLTAESYRLKFARISTA